VKVKNKNICVCTEEYHDLAKRETNGFVPIMSIVLRNAVLNVFTLFCHLLFVIIICYYYFTCFRVRPGIAIPMVL
jgi:hypothetical protein